MNGRLADNLKERIEDKIRSLNRTYEHEYKRNNDEFMHSLMYKGYNMYDYDYNGSYVLIVDFMSQGASPAEILEGYGQDIAQFEDDWRSAGYETCFLKATSRDDRGNPVYYDLSVMDMLQEQLDNGDEPTGYDESVFEDDY